MGQGRQILEKEYTVDVPAGVDTGSTLRLPGRGAAGVRGGGFGDLYVHVRVKPHPDFERDGDDLVRVVKLSIAQASLGCEIDIVTIEGGVEMIEFPAGVQSSTLFRVRGGGAPRLKGRGRGDLVIEAVVETPRDLTDEQEALLRQLAELRGEAVAAPEQGMLSRLRSAFR
jgi:molecular chaperone DnaJ